MGDDKKESFQKIIKDISFVLNMADKLDKTKAVTVIILAAVLLILLTFIKINNDKQAALLCDALHGAGGMSNTGECPAHSSNTSWWITLAYGIVLIFLAYGIYLFFAQQAVRNNETYEEPISNNQRELAPVNLEDLDDEEKSVYDKLKEAGGSLYQSDLVRELQISKVKVTRILDRLEVKGVIERKRRGMTNIVVLK